MDDTGFDAMVRDLSRAASSRRAVGRAVVGAALAAGLARIGFGAPMPLDPADAEARQVGKGQGKENGRGNGTGSGGKGNGNGNGGGARQRKRCGVCERRRKGRCKSKPAGTPCPGGTCRGRTCVPNPPQSPPPADAFGCAAGQDSCVEGQPSVQCPGNESGSCFATVAGAPFCGIPGECVACQNDGDCSAGFGAGARCVGCAFCGETAGRTCVVRAGLS